MTMDEMNAFVINERSYIDSRNASLSTADNAMHRLGLKENIAIFKIDSINVLCGKTFTPAVGVEDLAEAILQILAT